MTISQAFIMTEIQIEKVVIRPAEIKDLKALDEFIKPFVAQKILIPRTFDELTELIQHGFVAEYESQIVGFAGVGSLFVQAGRDSQPSRPERVSGYGHRAKTGRSLHRTCPRAECARSDGDYFVGAVLQNLRF